MAKYKVELTGIDTSKLEVLSDKEMKELFKKYNETKDKKIKDKLVEGNLKLVLSILKKFQNRIDNLDDLFQVGVIGLIKAVENFDLSYNTKFSTYGVLMIVGEIKRYLRDNNTIRVSRSVKDTAYKVLKYKEEFALTNGIEPSISIISKELNIPEEDIVFALDASKNPVSIFEPIYDDGGETIYLFDQIANPNESSNKWNDKILLEETLDKLKKKEKYIFIERYINGKTQVEISEELGISQAQVSRIESNAVKYVKKLTK